MKKILFTIIALILFVNIGFAEQVSINAPEKYTPESLVEIEVSMPAGVWVTALNNVDMVVTGGDLVEIRNEFTNKLMKTNGDKWIFYSLDQEVVEGKIVVVLQPNGNDLLTLSVSGVKASDPEANLIAIDDFVVMLTSDLDYDSDGDFDIDDVLIVLNKYFDGDVSFGFFVQILKQYVGAL